MKKLILVCSIAALVLPELTVEAQTRNQPRRSTTMEPQQDTTMRNRNRRRNGTDTMNRRYPTRRADTMYNPNGGTDTMYNRGMDNMGR